MEKIRMSRLIIYISAQCNLRCKLCSEYIPYISDRNLRYESDTIKKAIYEYFQIVSHVDMVTVSGGEPLLCGSAADIIEFLSQFDDQYEKLEIMTNGTLIPSGKLLEMMKDNKKKILFINDYGSLSGKVKEIEMICAKRNVCYITRKYNGENPHCGGWYDQKLLSGNRLTDTAGLKDRFQHCQTGNNPRLGLSFGLFENKLFACAMAGIAERLGLVKDSSAYVNLCDDTLSYTQKTDQILSLQNLGYTPACSVCSGNDVRKESERFIPAEQWN